MATAPCGDDIFRSLTVPASPTVIFTVPLPPASVVILSSIVPTNGVAAACAMGAARRTSDTTAKRMWAAPAAAAVVKGEGEGVAASGLDDNLVRELVFVVGARGELFGEDGADVA